MPFSINDLAFCAGILVALVGAISWLLLIGKRLDGIEQQKSARWHHDYFHNGGLVRALMGRWNRNPRLTDRTEVQSIELPESVDRA